MGVKTKWLRGDTTTTSNESVSTTLMRLCAPHPLPSTSTTGLGVCSRSSPSDPAGLETWRGGIIEDEFVDRAVARHVLETVASSELTCNKAVAGGLCRQW